jgi:hypothetical protein
MDRLNQANTPRKLILGLCNYADGIYIIFLEIKIRLFDAVTIPLYSQIVPSRFANSEKDICIVCEGLKVNTGKCV